ncbi:MAG: acetate kinase, partial [bacterium]|nr:acetate kinase [bacterium]
TLPEDAFLYALPYDCYTRDGVRRYGFHGSSHRSVSERAIDWLGRGAAGTRIITCHLGAGCSTAAVRDGCSIDTSMGMTPLEGLVMATRSGDVDPGVLAVLGERRGLDARGVEHMLQHESGLLGISGRSGDMKVLIERAQAGDERAELALRVFSHRARRYIGAHLAVLGGADAIVFTGGAGQNSPPLRQRILDGLHGIGVDLDPEANAVCVGREGVVSREGSPIALYVIESNEELAIARETRALLQGQSSSRVR